MALDSYQEYLNERARLILIKGKSLIRSSDLWTKGSFARDGNGNTVPLRDDTATCWCARGAIMRADFDLGFGVEGDYGIPRTSDYYRTAVAFLDEAMGDVVEEFNDRPETQHEDIMKAFDKAIVLTEDKA